jgi:RND family efflux transporter MFP subunit
LDDKADLLKSLKIDRSEAATTRGGLSPMVAAAIGAGTFLAGGALAWFLKPAPPAPAPAPVIQATIDPVEVAPAPSGGLVASGYVVARRQATVAAEVTGLLTEVRVEEGQRVKAGDVLAVLDSTLAKADADAAAARAASAEADLAEARRVVERTRAIARQGFASKAALTDAEARYAAALAQRNAFRSDAERAAAQLAKFEIKAPFDGVVVNKAAQPGEIISPVSAGGGFTRTGVCTIVDMASLEVEVDVSESYIAQVAEGQKVEAILEAYPNERLPARVIATIPAADRSKATVRVRIGFEALDPRILPEMAIRVRFLDQTS